MLQSTCNLSIRSIARQVAGKLALCNTSFGKVYCITFVNTTLQILITQRVTKSVTYRHNLESSNGLSFKIVSSKRIWPVMFSNEGNRR